MSGLKNNKLSRSNWTNVGGCHIPVIALSVIGSFLLFIYSYNKVPSATFYLLPTRAWELGAGCFLALLGNRATWQSLGWQNYVLPAAGIILIIVSYTLFPGESIGVRLILPVVGAMLVVGFANSTVGAGRLLSLPAVVYIGNISYSLYIWHWPVIVLGRQRIPNVAENIVGISALLTLRRCMETLSDQGWVGGTTARYLQLSRR
jgi:peptidoglycan/LPS O-acetylase OafA/YrhL